MSKTAIQLYRQEHPASRAVKWTTLYGSSGTVRRYTCVACGALIDSESGRYPPTRHARKAVEAHEASCPAIMEYETRARED